MKRTLILMILLAGFLTDLAAQTRECVLKISLSDDSPLAVAINGRRYNKHGRSLTIGDLPAGRHHIRVYAYTPYEDNSMGKANLIYSGKIRLEKGTYNEAIVDGYRGRMRMASQPLEENIVYEDSRAGANVLSDGDMAGLKNEVKNKVTDTERLKLMKAALEGKNYYSAQVAAMLGWLSFDDSKLDLAKWAYANTVDKQDYWKLESELSFDDSKVELNEYIRDAGR